MAETPLPELQPASDNPWYRLATAGEDHTDNMRRWNGYMRHLVGEEAAANLKRGDGKNCFPADRHRLRDRCFQRTRCTLARNGRRWHPGTRPCPKYRGWAKLRAFDYPLCQQCP